MIIFINFISFEERISETKKDFDFNTDFEIDFLDNLCFFSTFYLTSST